MSDLVDELRQHALMCANDIKRLNPEKSDEVEKAYGRVKTFSGNNCPACWVKDDKSSPLEIEVYANEANIYRCRLCGFDGAFPKT